MFRGACGGQIISLFVFWIDSFVSVVFTNTLFEGLNDFLDSRVERHKSSINTLNLYFYFLYNIGVLLIKLEILASLLRSTFGIINIYNIDMNKIKVTLRQTKISCTCHPVPCVIKVT